MIFRRISLPDAIRRSLDLDSRDKVLSAAELTSGWAVASRSHLHVTGTSGTKPQRRAWSQVDRATADPETSTITVTWVDADATELTLVDPNLGTFPEVLRERVQTSVVLAERIAVAGGSVRVAVRKSPDGSLFSQVSADRGVNIDDPEIRRRLDSTESTLRTACGMGR